MSKRKCPIENCCNADCHQSQKEILECKRRHKVIGIFDMNWQNQKAIECLKEVKEHISKGLEYDYDVQFWFEEYMDNKIKELEEE